MGVQPTRNWCVFGSGQFASSFLRPQPSPPGEPGPRKGLDVSQTGSAVRISPHQSQRPHSVIRRSLRCFPPRHRAPKLANSHWPGSPMPEQSHSQQSTQISSVRLHLGQQPHRLLSGSRELSALTEKASVRTVDQARGNLSMGVDVRMKEQSNKLPCASVGKTSRLVARSPDQMPDITNALVPPCYPCSVCCRKSFHAER